MSADFNKPANTSTKTSFPTEIKDNDIEVAKMFEGGGSASNIPVGAKRMDSDGTTYRWTGSVWSNIGTVAQTASDPTSSFIKYVSSSGSGDGNTSGSPMSTTDFINNVVAPFADGTEVRGLRAMVVNVGTGDLTFDFTAYSSLDDCDLRFFDDSVSSVTINLSNCSNLRDTVVHCRSFGQVNFNSFAIINDGVNIVVFGDLSAGTSGISLRSYSRLYCFNIVVGALSTSDNSSAQCGSTGTTSFDSISVGLGCYIQISNGLDVATNVSVQRGQLEILDGNGDIDGNLTMDGGLLRCGTLNILGNVSIEKFADIRGTAVAGANLQVTGTFNSDYACRTILASGSSSPTLTNGSVTYTE